MRLSKSKTPLWAWHLAYSEHKLQYMLQSLQHLSSAHLTDRNMQTLGIETQELDFETGAISLSAQPFFMPRADDKCRIGNTLRDPDNPGDDAFTLYRRTIQEEINTNNGLQAHLATAFKNYAFGVVGWGKPLHRDWDPCSMNPKSQKYFRSPSDSPYSYEVIRGAALARKNRCHRLVWMHSDDEPVEDRPSVAELIVLISWMLGAMHEQKRLVAAWFRNKQLRPHHVFPTMLISFQPRARARVLYGYFDGTLRVQMSQAQEFDVPDYVDRMDSLLRWAWPTTLQQTTRVVPLPTIVESDEEDKVQVRKAKKSCLRAALKKGHLGKRLWAFVVEKGVL